SGADRPPTLWWPILRGDRGGQRNASRDREEQTLSGQSRIEGKASGRVFLSHCDRPLDPIDAQAVALGGGLSSKSDAADHARSCPSCQTLVEEASHLSAEIEALPAPAAPADIADRVIRLRPFSHRERRTFRIWP